MRVCACESESESESEKIWCRGSGPSELACISQQDSKFKEEKGLNSYPEHSHHSRSAIIFTSEAAVLDCSHLLLCSEGCSRK